MRCKVPLVEQSDHSECGFATVAMILKFSGHDISLIDLRDKFGTPRGGTSFTHLRTMLEEYSIESRGVRIENPTTLSDLDVPVICHWEGDHFIVLESVKGESFSILDPSTGKATLTKEEFQAKFTGFALVPQIDVKSLKGKTRSATPAMLWSLMVGTRKFVVAVLILSGIVQLLSLGVTLWTRVLIDNHISILANVELIQMLGLMGLLLLLYYLLQRGRVIFLTRFQILFERGIMTRFMKQVSNFSLKFFVNRGTGDLLFRANLSSSIQQLLSQKVLLALIDVVFVVVYLIAMIVLSPLLTLIVVVAALIIGTLSVIYSLKYRELVNISVSREIKTQEVLVEYFEGIETVKALGMEQRFSDKWRKRFLHKQEIDLRQGMLTANLNTAYTAIEFVMPLLILLYGMYQIQDGNVTIGTVVSFLSLASAFLTPVTTLLDSYSQLLVVGSYANKIGEIINSKASENAPAKTLESTDFEKLELKDVSFAYSSFEEPAISGINLQINPGDRIAIVGSSGSGKSTLLKLLNGAYAPTSGEVLLNGEDLQTITRECVSDILCYSNQNSTIFNTTVSKNILVGDRSGELDPNDFVEICTSLGILEIVSKSPLGLESVISKNGINISGGQKQRIVLARSLASRAPVQILDEPTSALDNASENQVFDFVVSKSKAMVVVAHRLHTIQNFEKIVVMDNGRIAETGTHDELMANGGVYKQLYG